MYYFIDSANYDQIDEAVSLGACGITANTTMYRREQTTIMDFVKHYARQELVFFSGEVIGSYEEMLAQAAQLQKLRQDIVIKINFSKDGLRFAKHLHNKGIKTAMTLVFTMAQALACINAGCDYIFFFLGRNEEQGHDAISTISAIQQMITSKNYACKVVAASIKNLYQLEKIAECRIDYAAIPYDLYMKSLYHPLTIQGGETFSQDYEAIGKQ